MAFKMAPRSPLMKSLKGGQKNLPEGLKKAIEAAPGKMMDSPAKMGRGERYDVKMASDQNLTAGARKNYAENAEAAQKSSPAKNMNKGYGSPAKLDAKNKNTAAKAAAAKAARRKANGDKTPMPPSSPAKLEGRYGGPAAGKTGTAASKPEASKPKYDKELNSLVASRKGLKKGTNEYNKVQNQINAKLGNSKRREVKPTTGAATTGAATPKGKTLISTKPRNPVGELNLADAPKTPKLVQDPKKAKSVKVKQTAAGTTMTTRTGGGANKGGTTERRRVNGKIDKTVTKTADTRTVTTRRKGTDSADNPVTKTTKRLGKGRIKEAIANRKAKVQATRAAKRKSTSTQNKMDGLGK